MEISIFHIWEMEIWPLLIKHSKGKLSYADGVEVYKHFNAGSSTLDYFDMEDRYSRKRLKTFLDSKFDEFNTNKEANAFKSFGVSKCQGKINVEILPEELRKEYARLSPIIREISQAHSGLSYCNTDVERYGLAKKIVMLAAERRMIFTKIDAYMATGQDPFKKIEQVKIKPGLQVNASVQLEINRLRVQKSKLKKNSRRIHDYNAACEKLNQLLLKRYDPVDVPGPEE